MRDMDLPSGIRFWIDGLLILVFAVSTNHSALASSPGDFVRTQIEFKRAAVTVTAEIADSSEKRARGLMFRTSLGEKEAMVFVFDEVSALGFWMHNTLIPLSIIFLDTEMRIVDIQDMQPCREKVPGRCIVYTSRRPAKYAIETRYGFPKKFGIKTGDQVVFGAPR
jgi:uncharacterized protein